MTVRKIQEPIARVFNRSKISRRITENKSEDFSEITPGYRPKGKKNLSDFRRVVLEHRDDLDGKPVLYAWKDGAKTVATVMVDTEPYSDGYRYFGSLEVTKEYQGFGLGRQVVEYARDILKAGALAVRADNAKALKVYKDCGFKQEYPKGREPGYLYFFYPPNKEHR